jgi:hypothetical protein
LETEEKAAVAYLKELMTFAQRARGKSQRTLEEQSVFQSRLKPDTTQIK